MINKDDIIDFYDIKKKSAGDVPNLPDIPRLVIPERYSMSLQESKEKRSSRLALSFKNLFTWQERDGKIHYGITINSPVVRFFGCTLCPYYGSSRCFHQIIPPNTHTNGICQHRLNEVLRNVELSNTFNGKEVLRNEVIHKIMNHIMLLESNLVDYRNKRFKEKAFMKQNGVEESLNDYKFDEYEKEIMGQIQKLSTMYAGFLSQELALDKKINSSQNKGSAKKLSIQQFNQFIMGEKKNVPEQLECKEVIGDEE